jgi:peptidoglycan hydrolase CwlO-like protein
MRARILAQAETDKLKAQQQIEALERQCKDLRAWAQGGEEKVLALTAKCEHAQQQIKVRLLP